MATSNAPNLLINDKDDGHDLVYYIPVRSLVRVKSKPFMVDYSTKCLDLSTSWRLVIVYKHKPETGKVTCLVTLIRTDDKNGCMKVFVLLSYLDSTGRFVRVPKQIGKGEILAGGKIQGCDEESRYPGYRSYAFSLRLFLRVSVFIRNCHSDAKLHAKACFSASEKEMHRSKM